MNIFRYPILPRLAALAVCAFPIERSSALMLDNYELAPGDDPVASGSWSAHRRRDGAAADRRLEKQVPLVVVEVCRIRGGCFIGI